MEFKKKETMPKIMIIPMIDIIFFLLVFFMMSMLSMVHLKTLPVHLPTATSASPSMVEETTITITKEGRVLVDQQPVALEALKGRLQEYQKKQAKREVVLYADKAVPHGVVVLVMDAIKEAGIGDIVVATE